MSISNQINDIIENTRELTLSLQEDERINVLQKDLSNVTEKAIDGASKYIIKSMPVPDAVKDVLVDVKDAMKTRDIKQIISTAIKSTVREGLEIIGLSSKNINSIMELKDVATKGGLVTALKNGIEIVASNYLKNNIVGEYVYDFFNKLKNYIMNKEFSKKINNLINKLQDKKDNFLQKCEEWYLAYKEKDIDGVYSIAQELKDNKYILSRYADCVKENNVIQNMTAMVTAKKDVLTPNQERLCQVV